MPAHVRRWIQVSTGSIVVVMVLFVATTASNRVVETPELKQMFDIGRESNVPTFVNTLLLSSVAVFAGLLAELRRSERPVRRALWGVAAISTMLAIDEATGLHERFGAPAGRWLERVGVDWPTYAWLVPGSIVVVVGSVVAHRVGRALPRVLRRRLALAAMVFVGGALVMEGVNGWVRDLPSRPGFFVGTMVEETLEMGACVLAGTALLRRVCLRTTDDTDPSSGSVEVTVSADRAER